MRKDEIEQLIKKYTESDKGLAHIGGTFEMHGKWYRWDIEVI